MGILDVVTRRGKRKDAIVSCPACFIPGLKVEFGRFNKSEERGYQIIGNATVEMIDLKHKIVKFDFLRPEVKVGDVILIDGKNFQHEIACKPLT